MMTSWNGNIFRVAGHLCREFTGPRWIPHTKASDAELLSFDLRLNKRLSKQSWGWWFETPSRPSWRHRNENHNFRKIMAKVVPRYIAINPISIQFHGKVRFSSGGLQRMTIKAVIVGRCCIQFPDASMVYLYVSRKNTNGTLACKLHCTTDIPEWFAEISIKCALWHPADVVSPHCMQPRVIRNRVLSKVYCIFDKPFSMKWNVILYK